jgi:hypothetical protein
MSEPEPEFRPIILPELAGGVYANYLSVWYTPHEFTLDFFGTQLPETDEDEAAVVIPCRLVSRVRIPVTFVFEVLRAVNENMTRYEEVFGEIRPPRPDGEAA